MKHGKLILILLICTVILLGGCASGSPEPVVTDTEPAVESPAPSPVPADNYDPEPGSSVSISLTDAMALFTGIPAERTALMSSWAEYGFGIVENSTYYGRFFMKDDPAPMLISIELMSRKYDVEAGNWQILDAEHNPEYIVKLGDVLYYVMLDRESGESLGIAKVGTDGSEAQVLYEGSCGYLSAAGEKLFFTDDSGHPASMDTDGRDFQILLNREAYYLFALDEDWLIFQDDTDNESLHLFHIPDGADIRLNDGPSYNPVISGSTLFYAIPDTENASAFRLACIDLSSYEERYDDELRAFIPVFTAEYGDRLFGGEFCIFDGTMYAMNGFDQVKTENWKDLEDDAYNGFSRIIRFVSDKWIVEEICGKDLGITAMMFHDRSRAYASIIPW